MTRRHEKMLVDIDTQRDLLTAGGSCCVRNHHRILGRIRRIMAWVRRNRVNVISTCEIHPYEDNNHDRCFVGTEAQKKIGYTILRHCCWLPIDTSTDLPLDIFHYQQIIAFKRCVDPFEEPRINRLFTELPTKEFILIGATAEGSVSLTALGLLRRGKKVVVVTDAVGNRNRKEAKLAFRKMNEKGAKLIEAKNFVGVSHLQQVGICGCETCRRPEAATVAL